MTPDALLYDRWKMAWSSIRPSAPDLSPLLIRYAERHRHYHNAQHILDCFAHLSAYEESTGNTCATSVPLALFYHDVIYDPRASDNEARSAELASEHLASLVRADLLGDITRLIRLTDHRSPPTQPDEQLIVDIDLAILGQRDEVFNAYEHAIRLEYAHVPDDAFRAGRSRVLEAFLARPRLYHTPYFFRQYEAAARVNLNRSLARLRMP